MDETPAQQPLKEPQYNGKPVPDPNTDFSDESVDSSAMPQSRFSISAIKDRVYGLMRPKRKVMDPRLKALLAAARTAKQVSQTNPIDGNPIMISQPIQKVGYEIQNGLLLQKKSLAERVRDSIKFPEIKNTGSVINGAAMVAFAIGSFIIYSEIPTRPELVLGILIVAISANIVINNR